MVKFAHLGDCHLGGWRQPELRELNFKSFQFAIDKCIKEKVDFILISGDLFDIAYPSIDTLKGAFSEFRKLKESGIPVFLIAGSHDFSVSGKSFLDVLEKSGFCTNVSLFEERDDKIFLHPTIYKNIAIYGYPGKKSGLEVDEIQKLKLHDSPGLFKILMLHTSIKDAVGSLPIKSVDETLLPKADFYALGHLHIKYCKDKIAYSGPIFPNNLSELEELKYGSFNIFESGRVRREEIKLKEILPLCLDIANALTATDDITSILEKESVKDKVVILRLRGILEKGKTSDIDFPKIDSYLKSKGVFVFLKSTSKLHMAEPEIKLDILDSSNLESEIAVKYEEKNPSKFNSLIPLLLRSLQLEKKDDEKAALFEERVISENRRILEI